MTLEALRAVLCLAETGSEYGHAAPFAAAISLGLIEVPDMHADPWLMALTNTGTSLLAALRDAERVPGLTRERDEARAAAEWLARASMNLHYCHPDDACPNDEDRDCEACEYFRPDLASWLADAYTSTGGAVPDADAPATE